MAEIDFNSDEFEVLETAEITSDDKTKTIQDQKDSEQVPRTIKVDQEGFDPDEEFEVVEEMKDPFTLEEEKLKEELPTALNPDEELQFQSFMATNPDVLKWQSEFEKEYGSLPNLESKDYDYRGAWKAGIIPQQTGNDPVPHWASIGIDGKELKSKDHPTRWKSDYMEATGKDPDQEEVTKADAIKSLKDRNLPVDHLTTSTELDEDEIRMSLGSLRETEPSKFTEEVTQILDDENKFRDLAKSGSLRAKDEFGSVGGDVMELLNAGSSQLIKGVASTPDFVYDYLGHMGRTFVEGIAYHAVSPEESKVAADAFIEAFKQTPAGQSAENVGKILEYVKDNPATRWLDEVIIDMHKNTNRNDKSIEYYIKTGNYGQAAAKAVYGALEALPASIVAGGVSGGVAALGLVAAAEKKGELDKVDNVTEAAKFNNSLMTGALEFITEKLGTQQIGGLIKGVFKKEGKDAAQKIVTDGFKSTFKTMYKKFGLYTASAQEGLTEAANQWGENWTDILTGVDPDKNPMEGVQDAFFIGMTLGLGGTSVQVVKDIKTGVEKLESRKKDADKEMLDKIAVSKYGEVDAKEKTIPEEAAREQKIDPTTAAFETEVQDKQAKLDEMKSKGEDVSKIPFAEIDAKFEEFQSKQEIEKPTPEKTEVVVEKEIIEPVKKAEKIEVEKTEFQKTEDEVVGDIISESKDPVEVAYTYLQEVSKPAKTSHKEDIISKHLGKIQRTGYERFGDPNNLQKSRQIIPNYFAKEEGRQIDDEAIKLSEIANVEITPADIVEFIDTYPNGVGSVDKGGGRSSELARQFKQLTKKKLTPELAKEMTKLTPEELQQAEGMADEVFGSVQEKGINSETIQAFENIIPSEDIDLLKEYYNARDKDKTGSDVAGEARPKESKVVAEKPTKEAKPKVKPEQEPSSSDLTINEIETVPVAEDKIPTGPKDFTVKDDQSTKPNVKEDQITKDLDDSNIKDLPPERRAEQGERIESVKVLNKTVEKLQKLFPNVKVVTAETAFMNEAKKKFGEDAQIPSAFVSDGVVYIDPKRTGVKGAVEEFSHLWINLAKETNESVYNKGIELVKDSPYMESVKNDPNYKDVEESQQLEEALAKAVADKGADMVNASAFKKFARSLNSVIAKPLRKIGFGPNINLYESTLQDFTNKASKEILGELPITTINSEQFGQIRDGKTRTGDTHVQLASSLLDTEAWGKRAGIKIRKWTSPDVGGKKLANEKRRVINLIAARVKEGNFIVTDLNKALSDYTKTLKGTNAENKTTLENALSDIQGAMTNKLEADFSKRLGALDLPIEVTTQVERMRNMVDDMTRLMQNEGLLIDEGLRAILDQNMGFYLNRSYAKHSVQNYDKVYKNYMTPEQYNEIIKYLRGKYETGSIKKIDFSKKNNGDVHYTFTNKSGLKSASKKIDDFSKLSEIFDEETINHIQNSIEVVDKGSYELPTATDTQSVIGFTLTDSQIKGQIIPAIVGEKGSAESIQLGKPLETAGLGALETGIFKKKGEIDAPIRLLLGEILDPRVNFLNSITRMASAFYKGNFEFKMIEGGGNTFFTKGRTVTNTKEITVEDSNTLGGRGYYTTPEIYETLYGRSKVYDDKVVQGLIMLNGATKAALTIFKDASQARNFWGAAWNHMATGRMPANLLKASKIAFADGTKGQKLASMISTPLALTLGAAQVFEKTSVEDVRKLAIEAVEYGLIGESIDASILKDLMESISNAKSGNAVFDAVKKGYTTATDTFAKPYAASDEIFKLSQWFAEIKDFNKIYPEKSDAEIKALTAEKVRRMQPTYSLSPKVFQKLSRFPLAGSFVQFTAQMWQTRAFIVSEASKEIREGIDTNNPKLRNLGVQRLISLAAISSATPIIASLINSSMGWDEEDVEAYRRSQPSYSENNTVIFLNKDKKRPVTFDLSFIDPSSQWHQMITSGMRGEDLTGVASGFLSEGINPFANSEIFTKKMIELSQNRTEYGQQIHSASKSNLDNVGSVLKHSTAVLLPGIFHTAADVYKGAIGYETDYGKVYDLTNELLNSRLGIKTKIKDVKKLIPSKMKRSYATMNEAKRAYKEVIGEKEFFLLSVDKDARYDNAMKKGQAYFNEIKKDYDAMLRLGFSQKEIKESARDKRIPSYLINQVIKGKFLGIDKKTGDFVKKEKRK